MGSLYLVTMNKKYQKGLYTMQHKGHLHKGTRAVLELEKEKNVWSELNFNEGRLNAFLKFSNQINSNVLRKSFCVF